MSGATVRADGFYWVRDNNAGGDANWIVVEWMNGLWYVAGVEEGYDDCHWTEIGQRILAPNETPIVAHPHEENLIDRVRKLDEAVTLLRAEVMQMQRLSVRDRRST